MAAATVRKLQAEAPPVPRRMQHPNGQCRWRRANRHGLANGGAVIHKEAWPWHTFTLSTCQPRARPSTTPLWIDAARRAAWRIDKRCAWQTDTRPLAEHYTGARAREGASTIDTGDGRPGHGRDDQRVARSSSCQRARRF